MWQDGDRDGVVRIRVVGELVLTNADVLRSCLVDLLGSGTPVRLDLTRLSFIDSRGVAALVAAAREAESAGGTLEVEARLTRQVARVFAITGLNDVLTLRVTQ
jgi:anti-sigma B factor antagonist